MLVPVYDILNCGPRHRFWANGKIVHNSNGYNIQNLPRGSRLRQAIEAPPGHLLAVCDYSGVEARCLAWVAGQEDLQDIFRSGGDVYCAMATNIYGRTVTKEDKKARQVGKSAVLGNGYGMSWGRFQEYVTETAGVRFTWEDMEQLGADLPRFLGNARNAKFVRATCPSFIKHEDFAIHCAVSEFIVDAYRAANHKIVRLWRQAGDALNAIYQGACVQVGEPPGLVTTSREGLVLPEGRMIRYNDLTPHKKGNRTQWTRRTREGIGSLHGGLIVENICQSLCRHIMVDQMLQLESEGIRVAFSCHDEIVAVAKEDEAADVLRRMEEVMSHPPAWARGMILGCAGEIGKRYSDAK